MPAPHEAQPSKTANGSFTPNLYVRSLSGVRNWWAHRAFRLAPAEVKSETPAALQDAALQFSSRVWDIAEAQAQQRLASERNAVQERVNEANTKVAAAVLARGRAENHASQLEKRLAAADKTRQDLEKQLADAVAAHKKQQAEAAAMQKRMQTESDELFKDRADLERRLEDSENRESDLQKQIATLQHELDTYEDEAEKAEQQQQQQLEKAKQHYASLESRLVALLEEHKSARVGLEKGARGR